MFKIIKNMWGKLSVDDEQIMVAKHYLIVMFIVFESALFWRLCIPSEIKEEIKADYWFAEFINLWLHAIVLHPILANLFIRKGK